MYVPYIWKSFDFETSSFMLIPKYMIYLVKWGCQVTKLQQSLDLYISLYSLDEYKKFKEPKLEWWEIDYKINVGENYGVSN